MTNGFEPKQAAALLRGTIAILESEVTALPRTVLTWHPAPGEWCVNEVLGHLIEADLRGFAGRIRGMLAAPDAPLVAWDQNEVARARHDCVRDTRTLLGELTALRREGAALVDALGPADLARAAEHPKVGDLHVNDILQEWIHHDRNHLKQILANVQAYVWPAMGNAQKFSGD
jgi:DinB superfamily